MRIPKPMAVVEWYVIHNFEHIFIATMMELQVTPGDACEDTSTMIRIVALSSLIKEAQRQSRNILFGMEEEGIIIEDPRKLTQTRMYLRMRTYRNRNYIPKSTFVQTAVILNLNITNVHT